ncbi:MAG: class I SAM-dependent methyltransferase [Geitlerinemataceae cyanobacterium]
MSVLDSYIHTAPSSQNALDLFKGEWSSKLPAECAGLEAGPIGLFEDDRIAWAISQFGGVEGQRILELGPLEAGHTYMFDRRGAASITAIESNSRAYLKCLIVKEILGLTRSHFHYGDCVEYLKGNPGKFDLCCASGVLYHMLNPAELISLMAQVSDRLFLWTHYYDEAIVKSSPRLIHKFPGSIEAEYNGFQYTLYRQDYETALNSMGFCGGGNTYSNWMTRDALLEYLQLVGYGNIQINFDLPDHPNGPSLALTAEKVGTPVNAPLSQTASANGVTAATDPDAALQSRLVEMQQQLQQAKDRVSAMETSKFWKLRTQWFKVKKQLGLPTDE